jgi:hypothetical protein
MCHGMAWPPSALQMARYRCGSGAAAGGEKEAMRGRKVIMNGDAEGALASTSSPSPRRRVPSRVHTQYPLTCDFPPHPRWCLRLAERWSHGNTRVRSPSGLRVCSALAGVFVVVLVLCAMPSGARLLVLQFVSSPGCLSAFSHAAQASRLLAQSQSVL